MLHNILERVDQKQVVHTLHDTRKAFQPHAGVDIRVFHRRVMPFAVAVKLGKNDIPKFYVTVAVATDAAGWLAAAVLFPSIKVDLRARAAGT